MRILYHDFKQFMDVFYIYKQIIWYNFMASVQNKHAEMGLCTDAIHAQYYRPSIYIVVIYNTIVHTAQQLHW